jgi:hypothetical protein
MHITMGNRNLVSFYRLLNLLHNAMVQRMMGLNQSYVFWAGESRLVDLLDRGAIGSGSGEATGGSASGSTTGSTAGSAGSSVELLHDGVGDLDVVSDVSGGGVKI